VLLELKDWRDVPSALDRDWRATKATSTYVALVVAQSRELVKAEVDALQSHLDLMATADYAKILASEIAKKALQ
jgi:hypothetical protein